MLLAVREAAGIDQAITSPAEGVYYFDCLVCQKYKSV